MTFNKKILHTLVVLAMLFLSIAVYLTYFQVAKAPELAGSGQNPRTLIKEKQTKRGDIYDNEGVLLAESQKTDDGYTRVYPYGELYSHVIGYSNFRYGRSGIEDTYNKYLIGGEMLSNVLNVWDRLKGSDQGGANLELTLNHELQSLADRLVGRRNGSVVAIAPKTGEVLALVSKPGFDPNPAELEKNWDKLCTDENSAMLPRAVMGLYPPGSCFKPIVAVAAVEEGLKLDGFMDEGEITIDGKVFTNNKNKKYGEIDIDDAMSHSVNTMFLSLADRLGADKLRSVAKRFYIGQHVPFDLNVSKGSILSEKHPAKTSTASVGIGQGDILVTPMHMALAAAAITNDGVMMKPYVVKSAKTKSGIPLYKAKKEKLCHVSSPAAAQRVTAMMERCVEDGTGMNARFGGIAIAGKTGTAENEKDKEHVWFIASAPVGNPEIAVAVMLEYDGTTGSESCVPIARELLKKYLRGER